MNTDKKYCVAFAQQQKYASNCSIENSKVFEFGKIGAD